MFRVDTQRVEFSAPVLERVRGIQLNADTVIEAIRVAWPKQVKAVQRRSDYRASVTADSGLSLKCWRVGEQYDFATPPAAATLLTIDVRDLSAGGFGGIWKRRRDDPLTLAGRPAFPRRGRVARGHRRLRRPPAVPRTHRHRRHPTHRRPVHAQPDELAGPAEGHVPGQAHHRTTAAGTSPQKQAR
jgi:hypothetical protein